jgi:hypothetical protein
LFHCSLKKISQVRRAELVSSVPNRRVELALQEKNLMMPDGLRSLAGVLAFCSIAAFAMLPGCVVYEPAPMPAPVLSAFERAWNAALGAAQDEGVRITSEDRANGVISGYRDQQQVTINLRTQADGSVRIEMSARGPKGADPGLAGRISRAYDRRMGR